QPAGTHCNVLVLDTGAWPAIVVAGAAMNASAQQAVDRLSTTSTDGDADEWDGDGNHVLDPYAGHGTFIAGIMANLAPGAHVHVERVLSSYGDTDDATIALALLD